MEHYHSQRVWFGLVWFHQKGVFVVGDASGLLSWPLALFQNLHCVPRHVPGSSDRVCCLFGAG